MATMPPIIVKDSPNKGHRPQGTNITLIVLHGSEGTDEGDVQWILQRTAEVSYHYLVQRDGDVIQLVAPDYRAWHAGKSEWKGRSNVNDFSIGVAFSVKKGESITDKAWASMARLVAALMLKYSLTPAAVVGHYQVSPGRKDDPWRPQFSWDRLWLEMQKV